MLVGDQTGDDVLDDDLAYVLGLGIVRINAGRVEIANPIYREVLDACEEESVLPAQRKVVEEEIVRHGREHRDHHHQHGPGLSTSGSP